MHAPLCIESFSKILCVIGTLQFWDILMWRTLKSYFFSYFVFLFNFNDQNHFNSISPWSYIVLSMNLLQNKVNSTYDHCFARCMYEFKYICNLWNFLELLLTLWKKIKDENIVIEQTQLIDEIKWFVCLFNLIIIVLHANMAYHLLE